MRQPHVAVRGPSVTPCGHAASVTETAAHGAAAFDALVMDGMARCCAARPLVLA